MNNVLMNSKKYGNITLKPFCYLKPSVSSASFAFFIVLLPQIIMLAVTRSFASLFILLATVSGSLAADLVYSTLRKQHTYAWLTALVQGILVGLLLPQGYPPVSLFFITFGTMFVTKYSFGGFAGSWANPVAVTVALAFMLNMQAFPGYIIGSSDLQCKNAALNLIHSGAVPVVGADGAITSFLNKTIFKLMKVSIPEGYVSLFWDTGSIIPAFRFNLLTLVSSIVLISLDMVDVLIPSIFVVLYSLLVRFLGPVFIAGGVEGDVFLALLTSGTLFCTLFLLQWYGTTPLTLWGKILYGVLSGVLGFLIIGFGTSPIGYVFMVLVMDIISPVIQVFESHQVRRTIEKKLIPQISEMKELENVQ